MSLYYILFDHYSQKDSKRGVAAIVSADSDEQVFDWIASMPMTRLPHGLYNNWADKAEENPSFKEEIIGVEGEMFWDGAELTDLYYGKTLYGWQKFDGSVEHLKGLDIFYDLREKHDQFLQG